MNFRVRHPFSRQLFPAVLLAVLAAASARGQILINEVLFYPDPASADFVSSHAWLELYNAGSDPVDLTGWSVSNGGGINGAAVRSLPGVLLPAGAYLVLHFSDGQNQLDFTGGSGDYFTGDSTDVPFWSVDSDAAALYSPAGIADFVNWRRGPAVIQAGAAELDAVAAGIWTPGAVLVHDRIGRDRMEMLRDVAPGTSIGRDANSTDSNRPLDFEANGGESSIGPTPGRQNLWLPFAADAPPSGQRKQAGRRADSTPAPKAWTIMLYMSGKNDLSGFLVGDLFRMQRQGGSSADVNFVVLIATAKACDRTDLYKACTYRGLLTPGSESSGDIELTSPDGQPTLLAEERNLGDPNELKRFIEWTKANYPANNYGLVMASHGDGWKYFGPVRYSAGSWIDPRYNFDWLFMGELSNALAGQTFEWIAFDACLMAGIEVAHQIQPNARYMLASEDFVYIGKDGDFPYDELVSLIRLNPGLNGGDYASYLFDAWAERGQQREKRLKAAAKGQPVDSYTLSLIDLTQVPALSARIAAWSDLLAPGMSLFQKRHEQRDNVQVLIKNQLDASERFGDQNYVDLYDFASRVLKSGIPDCLLTPVNEILRLIQSGVVIKQARGDGHPGAHGLHIYFPRKRMVDLVGLSTAGLIDPYSTLYPDFLDQPYDLPWTRSTDSTSPLAHYGILEDQLPLKSRNPETGEDFSPLVWPLPQSEGLKFPNDTHWRRVLDRYYHPVADNVILRAVAPDGTVISPVQTGGGACANPMDQITVPVGSTIYFSGAGSSDADQKAGVTPSYFFWDKDDRVSCTVCEPQPHTVGPKADPADAVTNMDADQEIAKTSIDQKDFSGSEFPLVCTAAGTFKVTLIPWDDNHTFPFHNVRPAPSYLHTQSGRHQAQVTCTAAPPPACPTTGTLNLDFTVIEDLFASSGFVALYKGMLTMTRSGAGGATVMVAGNVPQLVPAKGSFDTKSCGFTITGTSTGMIAGFSDVQAEYSLTIGGANFDQVTGTYKVGLNNTLNNEPKPVIYKAIGTVTNAK